MKLELDFENKTITVKGNFKFSDLEKQVKKLGLEKWEIINGAEIHYYPIQTQPTIYPYSPYPCQPQVWYSTGQATEAHLTIN